MGNWQLLICMHGVQEGLDDHNCPACSELCSRHHDHSEKQSCVWHKPPTELDTNRVEEAVRAVACYWCRLGLPHVPEGTFEDTAAPWHDLSTVVERTPDFPYAECTYKPEQLQLFLDTYYKGQKKAQ